MYQQIVILGNLGRDPEMRYTSDGTPVTSFSVATNRKWKNHDGSQGKETVWFRVSAWRGLAEVCNQFLTRGSSCLVVGELKPDPDTGGPRIWNDNNGNPHTSFEVVARDVRFIGRSSGDGGDESTHMNHQEDNTQSDISDDDIPF